MAIRTLATSIRKGVAVIATVGLLAACADDGPSQDELAEVFTRHRPAVEKTFERIRVLETAVRTTPPIVEDRIDAGGARIVFFANYPARPNALFIPAQTLAQPAKIDGDGIGGLFFQGARSCGRRLAAGSERMMAADAPDLERCAGAQYVFVLRTHFEQPARLVDRSTFEPGAYDGDVLLFRLEDGALLGGFRVLAFTSDKIDVETGSVGQPLDAEARFQDDIENAVSGVISHKLRALLPGQSMR